MSWCSDLDQKLNAILARLPARNDRSSFVQQGMLIAGESNPEEHTTLAELRRKVELLCGDRQ